MNTDQRSELDRQGYLIIRNHLPAALVDQLRATVEHLEGIAADVPVDNRPRRRVTLSWGILP